jgi:CRP/FNR family transcriptional regulator
MDPAVVVAMSRTMFNDLIKSEPELGIHIIRLLTDRMSDFHHRVGDLMEQPVEQRLAQTLLVLSTPEPGVSPECAEEIPLTHEELSQLVNARRPTVSSILGRFAEQGAVQKSGRKIKVSDISFLARLTKEDLSN